MKVATLTLVRNEAGVWASAIGGGLDLGNEADLAAAIVGLRLVADNLTGQMVNLRAERLAQQIHAERKAGEPDVEKNSDGA